MHSAVTGAYAPCRRYTKFRAFWTRLAEMPGRHDNVFYLLTVQCTRQTKTGGVEDVLTVLLIGVSLVAPLILFKRLKCDPAEVKLRG